MEEMVWKNLKTGAYIGGSLSRLMQNDQRTMADAGWNAAESQGKEEA
jgi:hypothetical protein